MTPVTHALLPLVLAGKHLRKDDGTPAFREMGIVAFCGVLPDLLAPHIHLEARYTAYSHTLLAWVVFSISVAIAGRFWKSWLHARLQILCIFAYALHLVCDFISGGIPLFHPFSKTVHGGHWISYLVWYLSDVALFLYAWLTWRVLPRMRQRKSLLEVEPGEKHPESTED